MNEDEERWKRELEVKLKLKFDVSLIIIISVSVYYLYLEVREFKLTCFLLICLNYLVISKLIYNVLCWSLQLLRLSQIL